MTRGVFEELAERYDAWYEGSVGRALFPLEVECLKPLLAELPRPRLEVGVGSGRFAKALGVEVGLDPAPALLRLARQKGVSVVQGTGECLPFPDGVFGAILLVVTLCFVDDPLRVLRESARVVHPKGGVILGLVLRDSPWAEVYVEKGRKGHPFYSEAHFFCRREIEDVLDRAGLRVRRYRSVLRGTPEEVLPQERPSDGYLPEAGFTGVLACKS